MSNLKKATIIVLEEKLRRAMLQSNTDMLDNLLASNLLFTNHLGQRMTKQDDIEAHRSGMLKINKIILSEQFIQMIENIAIVSVKAHINGSYGNSSSENNFRFTRVWATESDELWQVVAGHSSLIAQNYGI